MRPEQIFSLRRRDGRVEAEATQGPTFGAEAGAVLSATMGVDERPKGNELVEMLRQYTDLVYTGRGETGEARCLRDKIGELSPDDYGLALVDIEIRRRKALKDLEERS